MQDFIHIPMHAAVGNVGYPTIALKRITFSFPIKINSHRSWGLSDCFVDFVRCERPTLEQQVLPALGGQSVASFYGIF
jgi:hypothetical protein